MPGTDSERVRTVLSRDFGDRSDGSFTVVFQLQDRTASDPRVGEALQTRLNRAAHVVPTGTPPSFASAVRISSTGT